VREILEASKFEAITSARHLFSCFYIVFVNLHCEIEGATNTNPSSTILIGALLLHDLQNGLQKKEKRKRIWVRNGFIDEICMVHQTSC
jgi:hypothetical protein